MKSPFLISLLFLLLCCSVDAAVEVEVGLDELTVPAKVDAPLLGNSSADLPETGAAVIPEQPMVNPPANPSATSLEQFPHLKQPAESNATMPEQADFPATAGTSEPVNISQNGKGTSTYRARADGDTALKVFLPTYRPAQIIVRLLESDGSEIRFNGRSLLTWERPDDKAFAPVFFRGEEDAGSMKKVSDGNYDAVQNTYKFRIEQGQRLVLEIKGDAEPASYVKAEGPLEADR